METLEALARTSVRVFKAAYAVATFAAVMATLITFVAPTAKIPLLEPRVSTCSPAIVVPKNA